MNPLDAIVVIIVLISMVAGLRRGLIIGLYDMLLAVLSLVVAATFYDAVASVIGSILNLNQAVLNLAGFVVAFALVGLPGTLLLRPAVRQFRNLTGIIPGVHPLDRAFGVFPGAIQGMVIAFVFVLASGFFSTTTLVGGWLEDSNLSLRLYRSGTERVLRGASAADFEPSEFFALTRQSQSGSRLLPFQVNAANLQVSTEDELEMINLVNAARAANGLQPLEINDELTAVGRLHAIDMFENGFFAHESPKTGSPFDRLETRGISYSLAGENLAFAQSVEQAHNGLLNSPGHRANIMEPGYRRVGIGAVESEIHGTMYVQIFTD